MINLIIGVYAPQIELLQTITKEPPAIVKVVEPTLQEKIASNYYKCNTDIEWIRADDATCLPKQTVATTSTKKQPTGSQNSPVSVNGNSYEPGQCVWFVKNLRPDIPNTWGNASNWLYAAQADGWATGTEPRINAVGWTSGHVVLITGVNSDGTVNYTDMNGSWVPFEVGTGTKSASYYQYIY